MNLDEKRDLLRTLLHQKANDKKVEASLSFGQESMYFLHQFNKKSSSYNTGLCLQIKGDINLDAFKKSLLKIHMRHDILRTVYRNSNEEIIQEVLTLNDLNFSIKDISAESEDAQKNIIANEHNNSFDLNNGSIWRNTLYKIGENAHVYAMSIHHIAFDDWSSNIFLNELTLNYQLIIENKTNSLTKPLQYIEFVNDQKDTSKYLKGHDFWASNLNNIDTLVLNIKGDSKEINIDEKLKSATSRFTFSSQKSVQIRKYCSEQKLTMFSFLISLYQILLYRYTSQQKFIIGTPVAGRNTPKFHNTIGYFVNLIPMVCEIHPTETILDFLIKNKKMIAESLSNQEYPLSKIIENFSKPYIGENQPLFNVIFSYLDQRDIEMKLKSHQENIKAMNFDVYPLPTQEDAFDLTFEFQEGLKNIELTVKYNTHKFSDSFIRTLINQYDKIVNQILNRDDILIDSVLMESVALPESKTLYSCSPYIFEHFLNQVELYPNNTALLFENKKLTYGELNEKISAVAKYISHIPIGSSIGICAEQGMELIIAIFAIIKSGNFYTPLDPTLPEERFKNYILRGDIKTVLSDKNSKSKVSSHDASLEIIEINEIIENYDYSLLEKNNTFCKSDFAYVLFTSGSTGVPKLVQIKQESVVNLVKKSNYIEIQSNQTVAQLASGSFDASVFEIFGALLNGACLSIISKETVLNGMEFISRIKAKEFDILFLNTALFNSLIEIDATFVSYPSEILFGGELVSARHTKIAMPYLKNTILKHVYGPTENTVFSSFHEVDPKYAYGNDIPIGKPINGTIIKIMNSENAIVPFYAIGEIVLSGIGLSSGYLSDENSKLKKFTTIRSEKVYKTGDYAYMKPNSEVVFIGRTDMQVKIRGHRIDLSEIESHIYNTGLAQKAIVLTQGLENNFTLVACIETTSDTTNSKILKDALEKTLPPFMIPQQYVFANNLKMTINGKIDREYVTSLFENSIDEKIRIAPITETQKSLCLLWSNALNIDVERISVNDNFFEIGGHSLLSMKLIAQIKKNFDVEIEISSFFITPDIIHIAKYIDEQLQQSTSSSARTMKRVSREKYKI